VSSGEAGRLLGIGAFARRSRLSVRALRLYDRQGLLTPAAVDPRTGYRRYLESQLLSARMIVLMRRAGLPLAQVAEILAVPGPAGADVLAAYWTRAERQFAVQRELVSRLRASLLSGGVAVTPGQFEIRERDVPAQLVLTEKRHVRVTELKDWLPGAMQRLARTAAFPGGELFVIFHGEVNEDGDGPVEICAPCGSGVDGHPVRVEPAHREAYVTVTRAQLEFPQILSAYDVVADWIGSAAAGPPREVYRCGIDIASAGTHDDVCDIAFPVRG
jgi:DNA-binding transcriptional MerR regulator